MPQISSRAKTMPPSPIRKLVPFAEAAKKRGIKVYHLNIGQPDIPTPEVMMNAFRNHEIKVLEYGHSGGLWEYREGLVKYYRRHNIHVSKEEILVTTAGSEAIIFAMLATMDEGDEMIVPEPFYTNYNGFAVEAGVKVVPVTCRAEDGFALPPDAEIRAKITPRTRAIMICNPNNPTGYVYRLEEMNRLRALVLEHDLFFFSDEVYREFVYDGKKHHSVLHLEGLDDRAVLLDSISKRYSACGARVGCLVTHNKDILESALRFGQARLCPPTMEQLAALAAVDTPQSYMDAVFNDYNRRRETVFNALGKIPGVVGQKPSGAFYTVVKLPVDNADRFCRWLLEEFDDKGETVMLAPANGFYATPGLGEDEVRIAFVLNSAAMERSMEILKKALQAYPGKRIA
ncbi:MAG: pyridoxal phosphate-dependent aminotransferase [Calditrichaeota bacterium]|nr:pyridoxal phosphate-dependent aminotransferase [Calditrichota bacterium]MCB0313363.1 pyridoxal phosphate-dependent aminotransferase [Calditrichota bacterium]